MRKERGLLYAAPSSNYLPLRVPFRPARGGEAIRGVTAVPAFARAAIVVAFGRITRSEHLFSLQDKRAEAFEREDSFSPVRRAEDG